MSTLLIAALVITGGSVSIGYDDALAQAKATNRPLVIDMHTAWCGWCRRMRRETFVDPTFVRATRESFVFLSLDAEDGRAGTRLARRLKVGSYPTVLILDSSGGEIDRLRGFRTARTLLADVDRIMSRRRELAELLVREAAPGAGHQLVFDAAMALEQAGRHDAAVRRYERLLAAEGAAVARYHRPALWNVAGLYVRLAAREKAAESYRRFAERYPDEPQVETALYQRARLQRELGRPAQALATFEELLTRFSAGRHAASARMQAAVLRAEIDAMSSTD